MVEISGSNLKKIREERMIPLEQIAMATHIRLSILRDLESEDYSDLSSPTQVKGFLKIYAEYLGVMDAKNNEIPEESLTPIITENSAGEPSSKVPLTAPFSEERFSDLPLPALEQPKLKKQSFVKKLFPKVNARPAASDAGQAERQTLPSHAQQILFEIGRQLATRRKYLNIPWELIIEQTHIKKADLLALEQGNLEALGTPIRAKGLLQIYSSFLNLDTASIQIHFVDALQERRIEAIPQDQKPHQPLEMVTPVLLKIRRYFTLDLLFGSILVLGILGFLIWGVASISNQSQNTQWTETLPAVADVLLTPQGTPLAQTSENDQITENSQNSLPTPTPFYSASMTNAAYEIVLLAHQNIWIRVIADTKQAYQGRLTSGNVMTFTAENSLELETGNLAALEIIFNQQPVELTGSIGQAAHLVFDQDGMKQFTVGNESTVLPTSAALSGTPQPTLVLP